ncbi:MAG: SDR family NAD(P)-dependent oxidoreductase [Pirellulales bacterium]
MRIEGNPFLITGGSSGLGAGTARHLVGRGARVLLADINAELGEPLAAELGGAACFVHTDVTDTASVENALQRAEDAFGKLVGVINCAGIADGQRVVGREEIHALDRFARVIEVNLIGTFNVLRLSAARMSTGPVAEDGERGVIVNTASVAGFEAPIGMAAYAASKAGVAGMTLPIARELAIFGIRVVAVAPGMFDTPMVAAMHEESRQSLFDQVPFPARPGHPDEFGAMVAHIIENRMINGSVLRIDGALRMESK